MSQITHSQTLPKNIDYWDYYILCRCNDAASKVLQRMEYWDGTKAGGNVHAEQTNDQLVAAKQTPTQDTSRFIYKTREELAWELIGACKERTAYDALDSLIAIQYLKSRHNPIKGFDRTLQYEFQYRTVQAHLDQLYAIIKCFIDHGRQYRPILFAIEQLTQEGIYLNQVMQEDGTLDGKGRLTIKSVAERLSLLHQQLHQDEEEGKKKRAEGEKKPKPLLPTFIKLDLKKDENKEFNADFPLCKNAQCIVQIYTIDCAKMHVPLCKNAQAIPVITTEITTSNYNTEDTYSADLLSQDQHASLSLQEMIASLIAQHGYDAIRSLLPSNPQQQEIATNDTESHSHLPHQGSEQTPPTLEASSNHAPPFTDRSGIPLSLDGQTMTPPPSVVANTPRRSGDVTNHAGDAQQSHDVATQDASFLPSQPNENTATPSKPSNDTRSSEIASQPQNEVSQQIDTSKQTSYSLDGHAAKPTQAEQPPLTTFSEPSTETPSQQKPKRSRKPTPPTEKPAQPEPTPEEVAAVAAKKAMDERCSAWQKRINKWRGYELETKGSVINERRCIRKLCEKYTDQQNKQIYVYLFETDWRWSKPDNRFKIGASEMLTEAGRVLQQLSGKPAVIVDEDLPDNVTPITSAQSNEPTTDLRVIAARARERALANGGN
jgi:hypothetical protein